MGSGRSDAPPRALSVGSADFDPAIGGNLRLFVDGVEIKEAVEYDCDAGFLIRAKRTSVGKLAVEDGCFVDERLVGDVTVQWAD